MKKVLFFLIAIFALHTMYAQPTGIKAANVANVVCQPIEFKYLGEFRMPNNKVEIRWQAIGRVKNIGNATFNSNDAHLGLAVVNTNTKVSEKVTSLAPGATQQVELVVKYMKGQPNPMMSLTFVVAGKLECYGSKEVPDWIIPN